MNAVWKIETCIRREAHQTKDGTGSPGHWVSDFGRIGSRVGVSNPVFDMVLSFNMQVYRGIVSRE